MKFPLIVLKEAAAPKPQVGLVGARGRGRQPAAPRVTPDFRAADDPRDVRDEQGVLAAAPPMPVHLIKSFRSAATSPAKTAPVGWGVAAVNARKSKLTGAGVIVAVLDTGIDPAHPAFKGIELVRRNFTDEPETDDIDGHGTHCAATIFGRDVDGHRIGVARGVTKALIGRVIGAKGGSTESLVKAIYWAQAEGAHIISMSLGMDFPGYKKWLMDEHKLPDEQATSMALAGYRDNVRLFDKISEATSSKGSLHNSAVVVAATGNESKRPDYAITVSPPAAAEFFLSVAAVGPGKGKPPYEIAPFSNDGAMFAAPGVDIWSAKPGGGLDVMSGTSMGTPHVAGVAALWAEKLMREMGDRYTAAAVIEAMMASGLKLAPRIALSDARYGFVQAPIR
jgi:subtilisin family serine protease